MKRNKLFLITGIVLLVGLVAGFLAGYQYKAYEVRRALSDAFSSAGAKDEEPVNAISNGSEASKVTVHSQGQEVEFATQKMKFNRGYSETTLTASYGSPLVADQGTKFVVVDHTVTNTTNTPFTYNNYILLDGEDKLYNPTSAIGVVDNYMDVRELAPNVPETGLAIFKVPASTIKFKFGAAKGGTSELHVIEFEVK